MPQSNYASWDRLRAGDRVGERWLVRERLGNGGHATVYRAEHDELGHSVAIKVLHVERSSAEAEEMLLRFRREAQIAARVQHRHVVRVFDSGELPDGAPYFVMELVEGEDLQARLDRDGPLPLGAAVDVAVQSLAGLQALADAGVVHRDVKPGNVMLKPHESRGVIAKLVDFGIASVLERHWGPRLTLDGMVLGTPEYMPPEQIKGAELDARADVYGLGVVLYESLTGALPFQGRGPCATLAMALTQAPVPLRERRGDIPVELERVVLRALAKERDDRWASPTEMARALEQCASQLSIPRGGSVWQPRRRSFEVASSPPPLERALGKNKNPRPAARAAKRSRVTEIGSDVELGVATTLRARTLATGWRVRLGLALFGLALATLVGMQIGAADVERDDAGVPAAPALSEPLVPGPPPPR